MLVGFPLGATTSWFPPEPLYLLNDTEGTSRVLIALTPLTFARGYLLVIKPAVKYMNRHSGEGRNPEALLDAKLRLFNRRSNIITGEGDIYSTKWGRRKKLKPVKNHNGYRCIRLYKNEVGKNFRVCRLVASHFHGQPKEGQVADHIDGIRDHDTAKNLRWISGTRNVQRGEAAVLSPGNVKALRSEFVDMPARDLAKLFGVHPRTIQDARAGRTWANV